MEEIKTVVKDCKTCAEGKPRFYRPPISHLIKATQPFQMLNIDFNGPLTSTTKKIYVLTVIDEYSWFPFAIPCKDVESSTVIRAQSSIFLYFWPTFLHSF